MQRVPFTTSLLSCAQCCLARKGGRRVEPAAPAAESPEVEKAEGAWIGMQHRFGLLRGGTGVGVLAHSRKAAELDVVELTDD